MKAETPIRWYDTIDSTNSEARRRLDDIDIMSVFAAKFQTAGRGQRGNRWTSAGGENLTFSILFKPGAGGTETLKAGEQFRISEIAALSVYDFALLQGVRCRIKWPNDIYFRDRKLCGILIENILAGDEVAASIIGIGLNLNQTVFPPELMNPVSLKQLTGVTYNLETALDDFVKCFNARLGQLGTPGLLEREYESVMYRKDVPYDFRDLASGDLFNGTIKGISPSGMLMVEMPDKSVKEYSFKEIGYII